MAVNPKLIAAAVEAVSDEKTRNTILKIAFFALGVVMLIFLVFGAFISGLLSIASSSDLINHWQYIRTTLSEVFDGIEGDIDTDVKQQVYDFMPDFSINLSKATISDNFDGNTLILYDEVEIQQAQATIPILVAVIAIFASTKSGNSVVKSSKLELSKEHSDLSKEHSELSRELSVEYSELKHQHEQTRNIVVQEGLKRSADNAILQEKIISLDKMMNDEMARHRNLPANQVAIDGAVDVIKHGWDSILAENTEMKKEIEALKKEISQLKSEKSELLNQLSDYECAQHDTEDFER